MRVGVLYGLVALAIVGLLAGNAYAKQAPRTVYLHTDGGPPKSVEAAVRNVLTEHELRLVESAEEATFTLTLTLEKKGKRFVLLFVLMHSADDAVLGKTRFQSPAKRALTRLVRKRLWKRLASSFQVETSTTTPAASAEPPAEKSLPADDTGAGTTDDSLASRRPAATEEPGSALDKSAGSRLTEPTSPRSLRVAIGAHAFTRRLRYNQDLFEALATYTLPLGVAGEVSAEYFPLSSLGLHAVYADTGGFNSVDDDDIDYESRSTGWQMGVRYRYARPGVTLLAGLDFGGQRFTIRGAGDFEPIPEVKYRYLRGGAEAEMPVGRALVIRAGGAYRHVFEVGQIGTMAHFPRLDAAGVDGFAEAGVKTFSGWEVFLRGSVEHYFYTMNPQVGDPFIAGGATDQYLSGTLGVSYSL